MPLKKIEKPEWERDPELPAGYLSPSAIDCYLQCPKSFEYRYILNAPDLSVRTNMIEGQGIHRVLETNHKEKVKTGEDMEKKELVTMWHDTYSDMIKEEKEFPDDSPDTVHARGEKFVSSYRSHYAKKYKAVDEGSIEKMVTGYIEGVPVKGYVDLISQAEGDEKPAVVDWKVTKRAKSVTDVEKGIQTGIYSILEGTTDVELACFVKTGKAGPHIKRVKGRRTEHSLKQVAGVIKGVNDAIKKGSFPPCSPDHWKCQMRFCGYFWVCPQGGGK